MDESRESLIERIEELEQEIDRLKSGCGGMTVFAGAVQKLENRSATMTVAGIEEMILLISEDSRIGYMNGLMAEFLAIEDRKASFGKPISIYDVIPGAEGVFSTLSSMSGEEDEVVSVEPHLDNFPLERLPDKDSKRPAGPIILKFIASKAGEKIQITVQEVTKLRWLEKTFSRYVPNEVIEKLQFVSDKDFMKPERKEVTLLFADLRGFTAMSEPLDPADVARILSSFFEGVIDTLIETEGTIDKFVGDEIMAIFGAPQDQSDHALRALVAALKIQKKHKIWQEEQQKKGEPAPALGIGIATGNVVIGNIGTKERSDYTAIGHTVNLAARLCGKAPGGLIYTVYETYRAASEVFKEDDEHIEAPPISFEVAGEMNFKNVSEPVKVINVKEKVKEL